MYESDLDQGVWRLEFKSSAPQFVCAHGNDGLRAGGDARKDRKRRMRGNWRLRQCR